MGRYVDIIENFKNLKKATDITHTVFGNGLFIMDVLTDHNTRFYLNYIQRYVRRDIDDDVVDYFQNRERIVEEFRKEKKVDFDGKIPIWVCWFQGYDSMPSLVKECYNNLQRMVSPEIAEIVLITLDNFVEYIYIDTTVIRKVKTGDMSFTNLSDLLRVNLLAIYGGMWIDATVYVTKSIDKELLERTFYSQKTATSYYVKRYITRSRWASWMMISAESEELFKFVAFILNRYYLRSIALIDYYLIDYVIEIAYNEISRVRESIDSVEINNVHAFDLFNRFNQEYKKEEFDEIISSTQFLKFTYKSDLKEKTNNGALTNYAVFREKYLEV